MSTYVQPPDTALFSLSLSLSTCILVYDSKLTRSISGNTPSDTTQLRSVSTICRIGRMWHRASISLASNTLRTGHINASIADECHLLRLPYYCTFTTTLPTAPFKLSCSACCNDFGSSGMVAEMCGLSSPSAYSRLPSAIPFINSPVLAM